MMIKKKREELNLTQKELSEIVGIPQSTLSKYEKGKRQVKQNNMIKISKALKTTPQELFFEKN